MGSDLLHEHGGRLKTFGTKAAWFCVSACEQLVYRHCRGAIMALLGRSVSGMHRVLEIRISFA